MLTASDYIVALEARCYQANKTSLEVLNNLRASEARYEQDVGNLKSYIIDLKARIPYYIPVKNDTIDFMLAEYINSIPDNQKVQIMFMRESAGVYEFGTKKVMVTADDQTGKLLVSTFANEYSSQMEMDEFLV